MHDHDVHIYGERGELATATASWLAEGLARGDGALLLATPENRDAFGAALAEHGWDVRELERGQRLAWGDAETLLDEVMRGGKASAVALGAVVTRLTAELAPPSGRIRAFGELVDLLWRRGERGESERLEEAWNDLLARRRIALRCGYRIDDLFERDVHRDLVPRVCRTHRRVRLPGDERRLQRAVDGALAERLGPGDASLVYERATATPLRRSAAVAAPQLALAWLAAHMPDAATDVLAAARQRY